MVMLRNFPKAQNQSSLGNANLDIPGKHLLVIEQQEMDALTALVHLYGQDLMISQQLILNYPKN